MLHSVLLLHVLPDGTSHFDWMIQPAADAPLLTFRVATLFDPANPAQIEFLAESLPDHRAIYLDYEGPISANRGHVRRLWRTPAQIIAHTPDQLILTLHPPQASPRTLTGHPTPTTQHWHFTAPA